MSTFWCSYSGGDKDNSCKEAEAPSQRGSTGNREDSTNDACPEPVREGCQGVGLATLPHGEHLSTDHPHNRSPRIREPNNVEGAAEGNADTYIVKMTLASVVAR